MALRRPRLAAWLVILTLVTALFACTQAQSVTQLPAPPAPTALAANARATAAVLTWQGPGERYQLELSTAADFTAARTVEVNRTLVVVDALTPDTQYFARVIAVTAGQRSAPSEPLNFNTGRHAHPYAAPVVTLSSTTSTNLTAKWPDLGEKIKYQVELAKGSDFAKAKKKVVTKPKITFKKLSNKSDYNVRVRAIDSGGDVQSEWSESVAGKPLESAPLVIGTYNILKAVDHSWSRRKPALVRTILGEDPDVVGLQEATPVHVGGQRQYNDLATALGPQWAVVEESGETGEARIIYNTKRLEKLEFGVYAIKGSARHGGFQRYVKWAIFKQLSTGKRFLFLNTHFSPGKGSAVKVHRGSAAKQMVATMKRVNRDNLPAFVVGDFNSAGNRVRSNRVYSAFVGGGLKDPLAIPQGKLGHPKKFIHKNLKTWNDYRAPEWDATAPMLDHIFITPAMKVTEWEVVARLNSRGRFVGTIPSDHNMLKATVELP